MRIKLLNNNSGSHAPVLITACSDTTVRTRDLNGRCTLLVYSRYRRLPDSFGQMVTRCSVTPCHLNLATAPSHTSNHRSSLARLLKPIICRQSTTSLSNRTLTPFRVIPVGIGLSGRRHSHCSHLVTRHGQFLRRTGV